MRRRLRRGRVAAALGILVALALVPVGLAVSRSSLFEARTLRVEGASFLSTATILREGGLDADTNVLRLDEGAVVASLRRNPWILEASVQTQLPSTVVVHVRERVPVAVADGAGVAADGVALPGARTAGLPIVRASVGSLRPDAIVAAAAVLESLPGSLRRGIGVVLVLPDGTVRLHTAEGLTIVWGGPTLAQEKLTSLRAVLRWAQDRGHRLGVVDVTVPSNPAARSVTGLPLDP